MYDMDNESIELGGKPKYFTGDYAKYAWNRLFDQKLSGEGRVMLYQDALTKIPNNASIPTLFRDIFKNAFLPYRDPETLKLFLKCIDEFTYEHSEKLGDAFEYLLAVLGSQGDAGQFRTPRHIIDFMVELINPQKEDSILDPACGTAGFLISAYKHIIKTNSSNYDKVNDPHTFAMHNTPLNELVIQNGKKYTGDLLTPDQRAFLHKNIKGYDIAFEMVRLSLVNMYLHGFNTPQIFEYDTLTSTERWNEYANVILANPPFMTPKGGIRPHHKFTIQAKRSEVLFVDYMLEHLTNNGRAGIIVPEGIIFQSGNAYKQLRKLLVEENYLVGVISLPAGVFNPYSGVKTSILWIDKALAKKTDKIIFLKINNDGFDLGAQRRPIEANDLPTVFSNAMEYKESVLSGKEYIASNKNVSLVEKTRLAENGDFNLSGERYFVTSDRFGSQFQLVELGEICDLYQPQTITMNDLIENGEFPVFGANGIIGRYHSYNHPESEVVITCRGATCGTINKTLPRSWITGNAMVAHPKSGRLSKEYLFYCLKFSDLSSTISGSAQPQITRASLSPFKIPLPPLTVQKEIVAELDSYQKIIDGAKQVVDNWKPHIDIDPKWRLLPLSTLADIISGGTPDSGNVDYWNGDIPWVTLVDLPPSDYVSRISDTQRKITQKGLSTSSAKMLPAGSVLVSSRATIGRVAINETPLSTNQGFKNLIVKDPSKINNMFLAHVMRSLKDKLDSLGTGGTFKEISKAVIGALDIPVPPISEQIQIIDRIEDEQKLVEANRKLIALYEQKIQDRINKLWNE
jgi:type I restriction enzyme M protein